MKTQSTETSTVIRSRLKRWAVVALFLVTTLLPVIFGYQALHIPLPQEEILLYSNQTRDDLTLTYLKALSSANKSILLIVYTLRDEEIIRLLREKGTEGLEVLVICDFKASPGVALELGPHVRCVYCKGRGHMHQKICVVDKETIFIGSANMTRESLRYHGNLVAGIFSPSLAAIIGRHADKMIVDSLGDAEASYHLSIGSQPFSLSFLPDSGQTLSHLIRLIDQAQKTVRVAMFTWTKPELTEAVIQAHKRGVKVEVVLDYASSLGASQKTFDALKAAGCDVTTNDNGALLHHKFVVIDDTLLAMGSANWTKAAFTRNNDCLIIVSQMTDNQKKKIRRLWKVIRAESS